MNCLYVQVCLFQYNISTQPALWVVCLSKAVKVHAVQHGILPHCVSVSVQPGWGGWRRWLTGRSWLGWWTAQTGYIWNNGKYWINKWKITINTTPQQSPINILPLINTRPVLPGHYYQATTTRQLLPGHYYQAITTRPLLLGHYY
jgi:hypothetical protein